MPLQLRAIFITGQRQLARQRISGFHARDIAVQTGVASSDARSSGHHNPARVHHGGGHRSVTADPHPGKTAPEVLWRSRVRALSHQIG